MDKESKIPQEITEEPERSDLAEAIDTVSDVLIHTIPELTTLGATIIFEQRKPDLEHEDTSDSENSES